MADPVASIEKIVKLGLAIKDAVDTVRHNEEECDEIRRRVLRFSAILTQLQQTGMMNDSPALSGALEDLEETLKQAFELVTACQERSTIRRLITAGDLSKQLRRVKDDILNKVMLASFAINAHTTILLLTIQAGGGHPPPRQPLDTGVELSDNSHSRSERTGDENNVLAGSEAPFVALREISLSEVEAATNHFSHNNVIGQGAFSTVYKGILNDGNVVAVKKFSQARSFISWSSSYDMHLVISKHQHKNIVNLVGYVAHEVRSPFVVQPFEYREGRIINMEYYWVEEYMPNGSLDKIMAESRLDWPFLFRIIEGVAQGINFLHERGIIHLDIKPSNVLLDFDMNPKIVDFGVSTIILNANRMISDQVTTNGIVGTIAYLDPEYFAGGIVTTKIDVYAFGVTLIEIVGSIRRSKPLITREYNLLRWAWETREGGGIEEVFDPALFDESDLMVIKRCLEVGLLCTQIDGDDRPAMVGVLQMLGGMRELPNPKIPAWFMASKYEEWKNEESDLKSEYYLESKSEYVEASSPAAWSDGSLSPR